MRIRVIKGLFIDFSFGDGVAVDEFRDEVVLALCLDLDRTTAVIKTELLLFFFLLLFQFLSLLLEKGFLCLLVVFFLVLSLLLHLSKLFRETIFFLLTMLKVQLEIL